MTREEMYRELARIGASRLSHDLNRKRTVTRLAKESGLPEWWLQERVEELLAKHNAENT